MLDVESNILAEHVMTRHMADGRVVEETTYVIDPDSSDSESDSSDENSGGEDVGEDSDVDDGDHHEREGDDETMVITFEDSGDHNDDHEDDGVDDDDDDDDDDEEEDIDTVPRPGRFGILFLDLLMLCGIWADRLFLINKIFYVPPPCQVSQHKQSLNSSKANVQAANSLAVYRE